MQPSNLLRSIDLSLALLPLAALLLRPARTL
jgi:hypothetical protein